MADVPLHPRLIIESTAEQRHAEIRAGLERRFARLRDSAALVRDTELSRMAGCAGASLAAGDPDGARKQPGRLAYESAGHPGLGAGRHGVLGGGLLR
ncbi:hypothetical protein [Streptomyces sp. NPDC058861]|uniref:hypothetical protein n=1 Tax=Streptomyces sp. NPDC058861 TaxID=3346653 RepID=UPI0036B70E50